jgi:hypothetical protein
MAAPAIGAVGLGRIVIGVQLTIFLTKITDIVLMFFKAR